jgi:hypothetical protein
MLVAEDFDCDTAALVRSSYLVDKLLAPAPQIIQRCSLRLRRHACSCHVRDAEHVACQSYH